MTRSLLFHHAVDFDQLKKQARELLNAYRAGDAEARTLFDEHHDHAVDPPSAKLSDAQLVLARAYDYPSWPRFRRAGELCNAIRSDDPERTLKLLRDNPQLLRENVFGQRSNWGPPLSVAAQLPAPRVFDALMRIEGQDLDHAFGRAALRGQTDHARQLFRAGATIADDEVLGPCETLNVDGLRLLVECGMPFVGPSGDSMEIVALLLEGYHRDPPAKHACLAYCEEMGVPLPDTPVLALHRGRLDLLAAHQERDPQTIHRRYAYRDVYPLEVGCQEDETLGLHGTPLAGTTLLHMAMDFDEEAIARWLLGQGADVNAPASIDDDGFGGHTPLFNAVVSQACVSWRAREGAMARLLLEHGADPSHRASIRKVIRFIGDDTAHEYRNMTALEYGHAFRFERWINESALALLEQVEG